MALNFVSAGNIVQLCLDIEYNVMVILFLVLSADEVPDRSKFYRVILEGVTQT